MVHVATKSARRASDPSVSATSFQIELPDTVLARARRGENRALEQIYRAFERPAFTLALRMLGDAEHARETVHDAMLHIFERVGQFRGESPFWGWLRQIVVNQALMRLRKERGVVLEELPDDDDTHGNTTPPWVLADARHLEQALARLPALTRSVLWLYHVEDYTHQEIAELTGKSVSFSKSQVARGSSRLRTLLEPLHEEAAPCMTATAH
jgi:RNA polymerase sigma-70 factor (ECF subfamily)